MSVERLKKLAAVFVNLGILPKIAGEVKDTPLASSDDELKRAVEAVQKEVVQFFDEAETLEMLMARIPNLPTQNYLRLRLTQHLLSARLENMGKPPTADLDTAREVLSVNGEDAPLDFETVFWRLMGEHYGVTEQERNKIVQKISGEFSM